MTFAISNARVTGGILGMGRFFFWKMDGSDAPELLVEITLPAVSCKIDAAALYDHAFVDQARTLFAEGLAARRKRDAAIRAQHTVPWQLRRGPRFAEHATDEAR